MGSIPIDSARAFDRDTEWKVAEIYVATLGYAPDDDGLQYWVEQIQTQPEWTPTTVAQSFFDQPLVQAMYPADQSGDALIEALYQNIFGRTPDAEGAAYWRDELASGRVTRNQMIISLIEGGWANPDATEDMNRFGHRIEVALAFANYQANNGISYSQLSDENQTLLRDAGRQVLSGVTADEATRDAAIAEIPLLLQALNSGNRAPVAESISKLADEGIVYVEAQLIGSDPDGDPISYHLISSSSGTGYSNAYVGAQSGRLYVTLDGSGAAIELSYNVSDGMIYSSPASVSITVSSNTDDRGDGAEEVDAETYSGFDVLQPFGDLLGAPGEEPTMPSAIDLSSSFPAPGDQGSQGSCVGWATAYAIKSYFEKRDLGWDLSQREHVFSPAFVFNAIALPGCDGSYPNQALDRLKNVGAATWSEMPYSDAECTTQPDAQALQQAGSFKIASWGTLRTVDDIKAQIANHRPVLLGIQVYQSFYRLSGSGSVYNDFSGGSVGGHAVAVTGYDDDRFGGALKVINSWSTSWGDEGFFWLPYSAVSDPDLFMAAYSIEDIANSEVPEDPEDPIDPPPAPTEDLPNLEILDWSVSYDPRPGGSGWLRFEIINSGQATALSGAYVNLMLSEDSQIGSDDTLVIYEPIPFDLEPGTIAYRDSTNALRFYFPDTLVAGTYRMALWVDDLDTVSESNETDNISFGETVQLENSLPDLAIDTWYAEWDDLGGELTYEIINQGAGIAPGGWDVNLMLTRDYILGNFDDEYLVYETIDQSLAPNESFSRNRSAPLTFSVDEVTPGLYQMALWIDDLGEIAESNERNNQSWGWDWVFFGTGSASANARTLRSNATATRNPDGGAVRSQYNGRALPDGAAVFDVEIRERSNGKRELRILGRRNGVIHARRPEIAPSKTNRARNPRLFPASQAIPMP